jgi:hypothetical protein
MVRYLALAAGAVVVFSAVAAVLLYVMPVPRRPIDFMIAGAVGTLAAMFAVFLALIGTTVKTSDVFFKKRHK